MARYDIGVAKTSSAATGLLVQLRAASTTRDLRLFELGVFATTAVAVEVGLIRPTAVGSGFTSSSAGAPLDNVSGAGAAVVDTAATTAPTIGTAYMRRVMLPAQIGAGIIWTFPDGIVVPSSSSLALWQLSAAAVGLDIYFDYDE